KNQKGSHLPSHPDPPERTQQHRPAPAINLSPSAALLEPLETAGKRSSFGRFSNLSFSLIWTPNQSCEAPEAKLNHRRDLQEVQLARTSGGIILGLDEYRGDSAEFSARV
ncbi:hypothetical protein Prudu_017166, partial [Prunus dulcis]